MTVPENGFYYLFSDDGPNDGTSWQVVEIESGNIYATQDPCPDEPWPLEDYLKDIGECRLGPRVPEPPPS